MTDVELQLVRGAAFATAIALATMLQRLAPHAGCRGSWRVNTALWLTGAGIVGAACGACGFEVARWAARRGIGALNAVGSGPWVAVPASVLVLDLVSYGWHRANHRVGVLWRFHRVHHSDRSFTVSTGVRFHPGELLLSLPVRLAAVLALGASAEAVLTFEAVFAVANLVEHGDIDLPRRLEAVLGRVLVTPALHRRHHARRRPERDTNFGTIFSFWDVAFGTRTYSDSTIDVATGLPGLRRVTFGRALLLPVRSSR